jgi:hypothetical protein
MRRLKRKAGQKAKIIGDTGAESVAVAETPGCADNPKLKKPQVNFI